MKIFKLSAVVALLCLSAFGQAVRYDSTATTTSGNNVITLPSAVITVCDFPATVVSGHACTNLTQNICSSSTATLCNVGNPITADAQGNFGFWAMPCGGATACYDYTICPAGSS